MSGVTQKFFFASMVMWMLPIAILYAFKHHIFPVQVASSIKTYLLQTGSSGLSSTSETLLSGFLAVIAVNVAIAVYIYMAMKEPSGSEPQPDPAFLAEAKASIHNSATVRSHVPAEARDKVE